MQSISTTYQHIVLASRPSGQIVAENFALRTVSTPNQLLSNQVLVKNHFLSLDPYMRGRMSAAKSYAPAQPLNQTMLGATAGMVLVSNHPLFEAGDFVIGQLGWTEMSVTEGHLLKKVNVQKIALSAYLGVLGMPGVTAWYGINVILKAKPGQTLVVSAASGAVGSVVGQLAKLKGCRVVGIAGGEQKCAYVRDALGFDACLDYKQAESAKELERRVAELVPEGIDLLFENVGSTVFDASLAALNPHARIALCGMIAGYNGNAQPLRHANKLLTMRATLQGFIVTEQMEIWDQAINELTELQQNNKLQYRETVAIGLRAAPDALIGLLSGKNFGKQLVKLA